MFTKILIANRGEIACRVIRTARKMGVATVAVYSEADRGAPHMRLADEAVLIGPPAPAESYLRADRILEACRRTGAQAVHPGYGFLSENADFAEALAKEGVAFIGPRPDAIRAMGSKAGAKDIMEKAGVPTLPGYQGADQSLATFRKEAARIGYPVLLKAAAGGGGKGMRLVEADEDLEEALASARREAKSAFGDDRFIVEKFLARPRHVEVQVFGDTHGSVVHLFERDCSVQRRHQKVIEEAPAPNLPEDVRAKLLQAGVEAARAVRYVGAGTVEFLYDGADGVYFMEMNTRLQVEHPVSEAITGLDFVEWQLRVAAGEPLPLAQGAITATGHAFEARLYAENPDRNFAPSIGRLDRLVLPHASARIDSGVEEGQEITPHYDPMIAKITTHGATREEALGRMRAALCQTRVAGPETNARFLHALAVAPDFIAGDVSTRFIEEHEAALFAHPEADARVLSVVALYRRAERIGARLQKPDPWDNRAGFRLNLPPGENFWILWADQPALLRLSRTGDGFDATLDPNASAAARRNGEAVGDSVRFSFSGALDADGAARITLDSAVFDAFAAPHAKGLRVWIGADHWDIGLANPLSGARDAHSAGGSLAAPMPGLIIALSKKPGERAAAGDTLLVLEAMKMEHAIKAPYDGVVKAYRFDAGEQVKDGDLLVDFVEENA